MSNFISKEAFVSVKPLFINLLNNLSETYKNITILVEKSVGKNYRVSKSGTTIKDNTFASTGAVIRLNHSYGTYEFSFNDFSKEYIDLIPKKISENLLNAKALHNSKFVNNDSNEKHSDNNVSNKTIINEATEFETDPLSLSDEYISNTLTKILNKALNYNTQIIDCVCIFQYLQIHKLFLSDNKDLEQHIMWTNGIVEPLSSLNDKTYYYLKTFSTLGGAELLNEMTNSVEDACKRALELLNSEPPVQGTYDVICMPDVTGLIVHEAFGHGVEMDMFVKDRALAKNFIGKQVASPLVTMHDNAKTYPESASYFFDDEGTPSHDTIIIKDGILQTGLNDLHSANILGSTPSGNGRRESFERKVYSRMTNTYFEAGTDSLDDMISSIDYGILLENGASGMEDPKNWGIQCMVNVGREIKNGKLTGKIFSPVCISGYVPDLLKSITMVSDEVKLSGCGYCGKGYKEWVKVSDGGPAIKARAILS
ncbi:MAG: TldD/PmbA family protein [Lachnospiraceae bacterium]|nr:TldD/PmbA family protein [Lachnospiraceae bacterium]